MIQDDTLKLRLPKPDKVTIRRATAMQAAVTGEAASVSKFVLDAALAQAEAILSGNLPATQGEHRIELNLDAATYAEIVAAGVRINQPVSGVVRAALQRDIAREKELAY